MNELPGRLTALGLRHVADNLDDLVALVQKRRLGARELLEHLVDLEEKDRARRSLERRTTRSRIGRFKPIADYDWNWPTRIDRPRVEAAVQLDLFADHRNDLIVDEVGYLSFDARNADLLFQVLSRRYERKSLVLTTNLSFQDCPSIFPNATCAAALIDRVIHHADVLAIEGESYRLREAEKRAGKSVESAKRPL